VNLGRTRADPLLTLKLTERCSQGLSFLLDVPGFSVESDPY